MPTPRFDRFPDYATLGSYLREYREAYPDLVDVRSIGRSHEGREIWLVALTSRASGPDHEKPAFWLDGNIHSIELAASVAALYYLHTLVSGYGSDPEITRLLDTRTVYICPRVNPDGAEWALAARPKYVRSSTRPWPFDEDPVSGLEVGDVDGDGRVLSMRWPDPNGVWKKHPEDPRLLVRRDPTEEGGEYFRVVPEGSVKGWDGLTLKVNRNREGIDLNRNFPARWRQEHEQLGAGPYPVSEPEVRALVEFISGHPNICCGVSLHTFSGVLLRPFDGHPDEDMVPEDLWVFRKVGAKGTELTGYPNISVYHDFRYHPKQVIGGAFDWIYEHLGMFVWTIEIWSPQREAGITEYDYIDWFRDHPPADDLKLLRWSDGALGGKGFVDWYPYDHPQLGRVEIGGWNKFHAFTNPPPDRLEAEVARFPKWLTFQGLISPRMELVEASATPVGEGVWRVRLAVQNTGWLPSYVSRHALERKVVRGVIAEVELPEGASLEAGEPRCEIGQLEGRAYKHTGVGFWPDESPLGDRAKAEWVVRAPAGAVLRLVARHERAGVVRASVGL